MKDPSWVWLSLSTTRAASAGRVWNLGWPGSGWGLAHCWVLKDQAPLSSCCRVSGGGRVFPVGEGSGESSGLLGRCRTCVWWLVLVGLLFEICIVDASILH